MGMGMMGGLGRPGPGLLPTPAVTGLGMGGMSAIPPPGIAIPTPSGLGAPALVLPQPVSVTTSIPMTMVTTLPVPAPVASAPSLGISGFAPEALAKAQAEAKVRYLSQITKLPNISFFIDLLIDLLI
jgi:hypothetical protein